MDTQSAMAAKFGLAGAFVGVMFTLMIGVSGGFLLSKSDAERMARSAVSASLAGICVAQITKAPNAQESLKSFKAMNYTQRDEFIEKSGWSKMPGVEKADSEVARQCAEKLAALVDKDK
jgi:hypothetical protein